MGNELDEIKMRLGVWCSTQEGEIVQELKAMGQNIEDFPFKAVDNLAYCNDDKNIAVWNNKISSQEQNLSEFERHKRHLLRLAFAINQYADATWEDGNYSQTIYHLDEAVFTLCLAYKLRDDQASLEFSIVEAERRVAKYNSERAKHAADTGHDRKGGSRDKQKQIRDIWATGKYTNRDICAEQECAALKMSFSTARRALRNTPEPT